MILSPGEEKELNLENFMFKKKPQKKNTKQNKKA